MCAFTRGFNPGDSQLPEVADTKVADREREIARGPVEESARGVARIGPLGRLGRAARRILRLRG